MYAVICSPDSWTEISKTIELAQEEALFKSIDTDIDPMAEFEKISRISVKYLIIDITAIQDHKKLITAIRRYRIKNDRTQIIVIAPNCLPGNELIHAMVTMGIYDIIAPKIEKLEELQLQDLLKEVIENPSTYKKAVKWDINGHVVEEYREPSPSKSKNIKIERETIIKEKTVTITKEKIVGTITIAVTGAMARIGTTHLAIQIAEFLKNSGDNKVAIIELHNTDSFNSICNAYEDVKKNSEYFSLDNLDFYPYNEDLSVLDILEKDYKYIIYDMGLYKECHLTEFKRANKRIIVSGVKDWELTELEDILRFNDTIYKNNYYFNFADNNTFETVEENMDQLKCYQAVYNPNPFIISKETNEFFKTFLKDVIPETKQSGEKGNGVLSSAKGLFNRFKK